MGKGKMTGFFRKKVAFFLQGEKGFLSLLGKGGEIGYVGSFNKAKADG